MGLFEIAVLLIVGGISISLLALLVYFVIALIRN